jgi:hypothetical protein
MRTLFSSSRSKGALIRRLSAVAVLGTGLVGASLQAHAEASPGDGGPAGGAFMSSYGSQGGTGRPMFASSASTGWAHHRTVWARHSQRAYRR